MRTRGMAPLRRAAVGALVATLLLSALPQAAALGGGAASARAMRGPLTGLLTPRAAHTATLLADGEVLVVGGRDGDEQAGSALAATEVYDPGANLWRAARPLATPRTGHTATLLPDGRVLVVGGRTGNARSGQALNSAELYDPA